MLTGEREARWYVRITLSATHLYPVSSRASTPGHCSVQGPPGGNLGGSRETNVPDEYKTGATWWRPIKLTALRCHVAASTYRLPVARSFAAIAQSSTTPM